VLIGGALPARFPAARIRRIRQRGSLGSLGPERGPQVESGVEVRLGHADPRVLGGERDSNNGQHACLYGSGAAIP
jgi:hypothetical protein